MKDKYLLVGRHSRADIGIEVIEHADVHFPSSSDDCLTTIKELFDLAVEIGANCIVFQALPGQANKALWVFLMTLAPHSPFKEIKVGQVVSKPGVRPAAHTKMWTLGRLSTHLIFENALRWANPNISMETNTETNAITATVTPPMPFVFSHIEWLPHVTAKVEVFSGVASTTEETNVYVEIIDHDVEEMDG